MGCGSGGGGGRAFGDAGGPRRPKETLLRYLWGQFGEQVKAGNCSIGVLEVGRGPGLEVTMDGYPCIVCLGRGAVRRVTTIKAPLDNHLRGSSVRRLVGQSHAIARTDWSKSAYDMLTAKGWDGLRHGP